MNQRDLAVIADALEESARLADRAQQQRGLFAEAMEVIGKYTGPTRVARQASDQRVTLDGEFDAGDDVGIDDAGIGHTRDPTPVDMHSPDVAGLSFFDLSGHCESYSHVRSEGRDYVTVDEGLVVAAGANAVRDWVLRNPNWAKADYKINQKWVTMTFSCRCGGSVPKSQKRHAKSTDSEKEHQLTKGLACIAGDRFQPCTAKLKLRFEPMTIADDDLALVHGGFIKDIQLESMHNHEPLLHRSIRAVLFAEDPGLRLYNLISKVAIQHPFLDGQKIMIKALGIVAGSPRFASDRDLYELRIGHIRRHAIKHVSALARTLRGFDRPADFGSLMDTFAKFTRMYESMSASDKLHFVRIVDVQEAFDDDGAVDRFCVLISTDNMLQRAAQGLNNTLFCDCTYRLCTSDVPLLVVGVECSRRSFLAVGYIIMGNETACAYELAFSTLKRSVERAMTRSGMYQDFFWSPRSVMGDGCQALSVAIRRVFVESDDSQTHAASLDTDTLTGEVNVTRLNCFFHFMQNAKKFCSQNNLQEEWRKVRSDIAVIANARSREQFALWIGMLIERWEGYGEGSPYRVLRDYLLRSGGYFDLQKWTSMWSWNPLEATCDVSELDVLWNSRCNNNLERHNREIKGLLVSRNLMSFNALIAALTDRQIQLESLKAVSIPLEQDYESLTKKWEEARKLTTWSYVICREHHFITNAAAPGDTFIISSSPLPESEIEEQLSGSFDPFLERQCQRFICYIPCDRDIESMNLSPGSGGPVCSCPEYVKTNSCSHICWLFNTQRGIQPPKSTIRLAPRVQRRGPITIRIINGRHTLAHLRVRRRRLDVPGEAGEYIMRTPGVDGPAGLVPIVAPDNAVRRRPGRPKSQARPPGRQPEVSPAETLPVLELPTQQQPVPATPPASAPSERARLPEVDAAQSNGPRPMGLRSNPKPSRRAAGE